MAISNSKQNKISRIFQIKRKINKMKIIVAVQMNHRSINMRIFYLSGLSNI